MSTARGSSRRVIAAALMIATLTSCGRGKTAESPPVRQQEPPLEHRHDTRLVASSPLRSRQLTSLKLSIVDTAKPDEPPAVLEGAPVHVVVVSRDLQFFEHRHPGRAGGFYEFSITFPRDGDYVAFVYYRLLDEKVEIASSALRVGTERTPTATLQLVPRTQHGRSSDIVLAVQPDPPHAEDWTALTFSIRNRKPSARQTQKTLTDHVVIIGEGASTFVYAHSSVGEARGGMRGELHLPANPLGADGDPQVGTTGTEFSYHARFPNTGRYKIWFETPDADVVAFVVAADGRRIEDRH